MAALPSHIGDFEVIRQLGSGGMGTVYLGRDVALNRPVAIKMLREQVQDRELLARFLREAQAAATLRHPNIITIHATGHHEYQPYIVMEFVEGESLADVIAHRRPVTLADKLSYLEQICAGLHFAHRAGIVHRDVKPANLLVDREGVIRILDFGIARTAGSGMTRDGALIGTLNYMSPEQMLGRPIDHRSDIFAVGAVAYELLCYQQAFRGGLEDGLLHRLPHEDPPSLGELYKDLPPGIERIVVRALQKAPEHRFADLAEMRAAIVDIRRQMNTEAGLQTVVVRPGPARTPESQARSASAEGSQRDAFGLLEQPREDRELSVRHYLSEANARLEKGETAAALLLIRDAMAVDPTNVTAREMLARVQQLRRGEVARPERPRPRSRVPVWIAAGALGAAALAAVPWLLRDSAGTQPVEPGAQPTAAVESPVPAAPPSIATALPSTRGAAEPPSTPPARAPTPAVTDRPVAPAPPVGRAALAPAPTPAPSDAPPVDTAIQDLLARVRTMYTGGDLPGALDLLARNAAAGSDTRIGEVATRVAAAAFDAMSSAEKTAVARNAPELAGDTWRIALDAKERAEAARERSAHVDGGLQALLARDAFQQAATDALGRRSQPAATPAPAGAAAPTAPSPAAATPNPLEKERPGLVAALGRFQAAYRDRDINAVLQIYPALQREARQALQRSFDNCRAYDVQFDDMRFLIDPAEPTTAQVNVRSTYVCTPRTGQRAVSAAQRDVFTLRKRGDLWVIENTGRVD